MQGVQTDEVSTKNSTVQTKSTVHLDFYTVGVYYCFKGDDIMNSSFYKAEADELLAINNRKSDFVKITLVTFLVSIACTVPRVLISNSIIDSIIALLLNLATTIIISPMIGYLLSRTAYKVYCKKDIDINDLFTDYSKFTDIVLYSFFTNIIILLGILLFIVPGIMLTYSYRLGYSIMIDEPGISFNDAMKKSKEMMKGHRFELFKLDFSFWGWLTLSFLTCGILLLWVQPRMHVAEMVFYARLKKELYGEDINGITESDAPVDNNSSPISFEDAYEPTAYEPVAEADALPEYQAPACEPVDDECAEAETEE